MSWDWVGNLTISISLGMCLSKCAGLMEWRKGVCPPPHRLQVPGFRNPQFTDRPDQCEEESNVCGFGVYWIWAVLLSLAWRQPVSQNGADSSPRPQSRQRGF